MADEPSPTILIVDDVDASRYTLRRMLQKAQFSVREAANGKDALRLVAEKPDLVILDINLPDMSGQEVCKQIKANPSTASIPVLHLSASFIEADNRAEGLESGADGYLTYPVEPRELLATVGALLRARRAEQQVREQRELLQVTLRSIADAVIATDIHGRVTFLNPAALTLTGWNEEKATGKPLADIFRILNIHTRQPAVDLVERLLRDGAIPKEERQVLLAASDDTEKSIDVSAAAIRDTQGQFLGVVVIFRDISERLRTEEALKEAGRRKDEFLAMLAHELRNPLAPISNCLQLLNATGSQEQAAVEARGIMGRQLEQMVRLIDDLLDISRISRGKVELRKERVELATVLRSALEASRPLIERHQHELAVALPSGPVCLLVDPVRIAQAVLNLLNNAAKYTEPGGRIWLTANLEGAFPGEAVVRVRDTGEGISAEMLPRVFDMFTQADHSLVRTQGGLGIGLTLVRSLVELHGGTVAAHSEGRGRGSEFVIRLPLAPELASAEARPPAAESPRIVPRHRVLVVDDNQDAANSLAMLVRLWGSETVTVYNGPAALAAAAVFRPNVVLLDIGLPGLHGYDVARRLRENKDLTGMTLVALTGWGQEDDRRQSREAGFDHHMVKPVNISELQALLASIASSLT